MEATLTINTSITADHFAVTTDEIKSKVEQYSGLADLVIKDPSDVAAVHKARMELRNVRIAIEKRRKELKADSLEFGRNVDKVAKLLTEIVTPTEKALQQKEDDWNEARERERKVKLQKRVDALLSVGASAQVAVVEKMNDTEFAELLNKETEAFNAEQERLKKEAEENARLEAEEIARRAEEERLAEEKRKAEEARLAEERRQIEAERERLEAQRREQQERERLQREEQERIAAEQRRLDEAQRKRDQEEREQIEAERRKLEEERLRIEREERERLEAQRRAEQEEKERQRRTAMRPDREKLLAVADAISGVELPEVSKESEDLLMEISQIIGGCAETIRLAVRAHIPAREV